MVYTTIDDVCASFPSVQRNAPGSVQDDQIQDWIDDWKARIRGAFLSRNIDPDALTLTADQMNFLRGLNRDGAIAELGDAVQGVITLQPSELALVGARRRSCERVVEQIKQGLYDVMFSGLARHVEIEPLFGGIGGAETDESTPQDRGENRAFGKDQVF
jgi:hypothetical protein